MISKVEGLLKFGEPVFSDNKNINRYEVIKMILKELSVTTIAYRLGVNRKTIYWHFKKIKLEFDLDRINATGRYSKIGFKRALQQQGFKLDVNFQGARAGLPPVSNFTESILPRGL